MVSRTLKLHNIMNRFKKSTVAVARHSVPENLHSKEFTRSRTDNFGDKGHHCVHLMSEWKSKWIVWTLYLVGFMDLFGVSMIIPLLPKLIYNLGASRVLAGIIGSLYGAIQIFSSPMMGKLSDIYGRKNLLLLSCIGPFLGYIVIGLSTSLMLLIISRILHGFLKHGLSVSKAYLADIASVQERQSVLGMFNACSSLGFIFGPLISGYLADRDPSLHLSVLTGTVVIGVNIILVAVLVPSISSGTDDQEVVSDSSVTRTAVQLVLSSFNSFRIDIHWWELLDVITVQFLLTFSAIMFKGSFVVFMEEKFHISGTTLGKILSFNALISALGSATSGRISKFYSDSSKQVVHFTLLLAVSLMCLTLAPNVVFLTLFLVPLSLSSSNLRICLLSLMLHRGREEKGAIVGLANSISSVSRMLAPTIVGVSQEYSVTVPGYLSLVLALGAAGVSFGCYWNLKPKAAEVDNVAQSRC